MALNSAMRVCSRVQIPVCPEPPLVFSHELPGGLRTGFLVVSPLRIACVFLHVERGRSSQRVWRSPRIIYYHYGSQSSPGSRSLIYTACSLHDDLVLFSLVRFPAQSRFLEHTVHGKCFSQPRRRVSVRSLCMRNSTFGSNRKLLDT
jgi:hypothetical protein